MELEYGHGVRLNHKARTIEYLIAGMIAEDEDGNEAEGLVNVKLALKNGAEFQSIKAYEEMAPTILQMQSEFFEVPVSKFRLLDRDEFLKMEEDCNA